MAGLKPIGTIASYWALHCSCLVSAVQVHTTTHCKFYREQFDPAPLKAGPWPTAGKSCLFDQKPRSRMPGAKIPIECDNGAMKFLRADVDIFNLIHLPFHALCSSDRDSPRFLCRPTALYIFARAVGCQRAIHMENNGFASPTLGQHISTFRGYRILFSIRNPYINRFTNPFSIHS